MKVSNYLLVFGIGMLALSNASAQDYLSAVRLGAPEDSRTLLVAEIVPTTAVNRGECKVKIGTPICADGCRERVVAVPCPGGCETKAPVRAASATPTCTAAPAPCGPAVKIVSVPAACATKICSPCEAKPAPCASAPARATSCGACEAAKPRPARPILDWLARLFQSDRQHHAASPCETGNCGNNNSIVAPVQPVPAVVPAIPLPNLPPPMPRAISHTEEAALIPIPAAFAPYSQVPNSPR